MATFGRLTLCAAVTNYFYDIVLRFFARAHCHSSTAFNCTFMPRYSHHVDKLDKLQINDEIFMPTFPVIFQKKKDKVA